MDDDQQTVEDLAQRRSVGERQVKARTEEYIHRGGHRAASAMSKDDNEFEAAPQALDGEFQATQHVAAKTVTGHSDDKEIVRSFIEDQFQRDPRVRAAKNGRKRTL